MISKQHNLEASIKDLNRTHTIWRCRSEDDGNDTSLDNYSISWLEKEWEESSDLDDEAEEIIYTYSTQLGNTDDLFCTSSGAVSITDGSFSMSSGSVSINSVNNV